MPPYIYDTANRIILASQLWEASFDPSYGGSLMALNKPGDSQNVIYDHAGAAGSIMWNSGNDPTLASANGIARNEIHQFRKADRPRAIVRETEYGNGGYAVEGSAPYFWMSHEHFDDYIPDSVNRWQTLYNNIRPDLAPFAHAWNTPVYFIPAANQLHGSLFVGNENASYRGTPHSVYTSNFSISANIRFVQANSHGGNVASLIATSKQAEGLRFDLNAMGQWAVLHRGTIQFAGAVPLSKVSTGLKAELVFNEGLVSLYLEDQPVGGASINNIKDIREFGIQGRMINTNGFIEFGNRQFVDLDETVKVRYSVASDGALQIDAELTSFNPLFRTNLPGVFLARELIGRRVLILKDGRRFYDNQIYDTFGTECFALDEVAAVYTGNGSGTHGLLAYDFKSDCKMANNNQYRAHLLIGTDVIALNNLPLQANEHPVLAQSGKCTMSSKWLPYWDDETINGELE